MSKKTNILGLKESLTFWKSKMKNSEKFVKIHQEFINQPENYLSLAMEYMEGYSLQDLILNIGCLNEDLLKPISMRIIECLLDYNIKFGTDFKDFCPCDIVFDKKGNIKMVPYLTKLPKIEMESENKNEVKCKCFDFFHSKTFLNLNNINTHSTNESQSQSSNNLRKSEENMRFPNNSFNLGFIILISLLGGSKVGAMDALNYTNISELQKGKMCCLLHYLLLYDENNQKNKVFKFSSFVKISKELTSFLCDLLSFDSKKNLKVMRSNVWYKSPRVSKTKIYLKELIKIVKEIKRPSVLIKNDTLINNFISSLGIILMNTKDTFNNNTFAGKLLDSLENVRFLVDQKRHFIKMVCKELGSSFSELNERIINLIIEIKKDKFLQK